MGELKPRLEELIAAAPCFMKIKRKMPKKNHTKLFKNWTVWQFWGKIESTGTMTAHNEETIVFLKMFQPHPTETPRTLTKEIRSPNWQALAPLDDEEER